MTTRHETPLATREPTTQLRLEPDVISGVILAEDRTTTKPEIYSNSKSNRARAIAERQSYPVVAPFFRTEKGRRLAATVSLPDP